MLNVISVKKNPPPKIINNLHLVTNINKWEL